MTRYSQYYWAGFTLIEVMVVVVILGILAAIIVQRIMDRHDEARIIKAKQDIRVLESALNLYRLDNYDYPTTDQGLEALVQKPTVPPEPPRWKKETARRWQCRSAMQPCEVQSLTTLA